MATVDDYVRLFMQMVKYYQYLKGNQAGTGSGKEEMLFRVAQHFAKQTGNPKSLTEALSNIPGIEEFVHRKPQLEVRKSLDHKKERLTCPLDASSIHIGQTR